MPRSVEAIVWDLDGTLVDSSIIVPDAFAAAVAELGGDACGREQVVAAFDLGPPPVVLTHLLQRPVTEADVAVYHRILRATVPTVRAYPEITETLETVGTALPMGVFTGNSRRATELLLDHSGLSRFFYHVITGADTTHHKPHPNGLELLSARMEVAVGGMVFVGDSPLDAQAARSAGAIAIAAAWGHRYELGMDGGVDVVCARPPEVAEWALHAPAVS